MSKKKNKKQNFSNINELEKDDLNSIIKKVSKLEEEQKKIDLHIEKKDDVKNNDKINKQKTIKDENGNTKLLKNSNNPKKNVPNTESKVKETLFSKEKPIDEQTTDKKEINNLEEIEETQEMIEEAIEDQPIDKEETIEEQFDKKEDIKNFEDNEKKVEIKSAKKHNILIILLVGIVLIALIGYFCLPRISINGNKHVKLNYSDIYVEPGYSGKKLFIINITDKIIIDNDIKNGAVGNYKVIYKYKFLFIWFKKTRYVDVVDLDIPIITIDDVIKLCPKENIKDIKYLAIDAYDGDISDKVIFNEIGDKLVLTVTDSSNNKSEKTVDFSREDTEAPKITLDGVNKIYMPLGSKYNDPGYKALDNCDGDITSIVSVSGQVLNSPGKYTLTYSVIDSSNNKSEVSREVVVYQENNYNDGNIANGEIYLTFDDGPNDATTGYILDVLKDEGVKATFFVTCNGSDYLIKRMSDEGHTVGLHTASHNYSYIYSSVDNYFEDLNRVSDRVKRITGIESKIIRFPGGSSNTVSRSYSTGIMRQLTSIVLNRGYRYYDWNIDSNDAGGAGSSYAVYSNVINSLSKNRANMILMHDIKYTTKGAIRDIIRYGKNNGYVFRKIDMNTYMITHGVNN